MNKFLSLFFTLLIGLGIGAGGLWFYQQKHLEPSMEKMVSSEKKAEPKPLFYRNPMNPEITSPVPAKDHMGMDYIPVYADDEQAGKAPAGTVMIDPVTEQNIGVRTAEAQLRPLSHPIRTVGKISYDEERISRLHPKTEGWIEKLFIDKTGTRVSRNTMLLSIYSPQLVTSAQEYLLAKQSAKTLENSPFEDIRNSAKQMVDTARERLTLLDVPEHQIRDIEENGKIQKDLHIHSPFDGTVIQIGAREGQYVTPQTELYVLADLSKVWVIAQVYESDLPWVSEGDPVEMQLTALPGETFQGHLSYIYPYAEAETRTIKVRLVFDNPDRKLKPEMFANVTIHTQQQDNAITVPSEAIVRSGSKEQVFVLSAPGKFEPRQVRTGLSADGLTQILSGIKTGEQVVTSSQFLIDSESKLRESTAKMRPINNTTDSSMNDMSADDSAMSGMDMDSMQGSSNHTMSDDSHDMTTHQHNADSAMPDMQMDTMPMSDGESMTDGHHDMEAHQHD